MRSFKIIHRFSFCPWESRIQSRKVAPEDSKRSKRSTEHFSFCLVEMQTNMREGCLSIATTKLTSSPYTSGSSTNGTSCGDRLQYSFSAHAHLISDHFHEATKHSVLVPFCGLLLSVSVCRLPRSATSQSIWVLSCTVKCPGLAHDNGRGCVKYDEIKSP